MNVTFDETKVPDAGSPGWWRSVEQVGSVVMLSTADYDAPLWTNKQHIASRLADRIPVLYIESVGLRKPRLSRTDIERMARRLVKSVGKQKVRTSAGRQTPELLTVLSPIVVPAHGRRIIRKINRILLRKQIERQLDALPHPRVLWTYTPLAIDLIDMELFDFSLYHCVDDLGSIPGVSSKLVDELERRAAPRMDAIVTTSSALQGRLKTLNPNTHYFHNVVDADHFARATQVGSLPLDLAGIPDPRAIFVGALSDHKIDWPLLIKVAQLLPKWSFVMIGPIGEEVDQHGYESASGAPNIYLIGHRSYEELPDYMRGGRVGLIPYRLTKHTASIFPMKALEYLAAGLSVVSTPLPAFQGHPDLAVVQRSDAGGFAEALADVLRAEDVQGKRAAIVETWDDLLTLIFSLISPWLMKLPASDI